MERRRARLLALALGTALAFAIAATVWPRREPASTVEMVDRSEALAALRARRPGDPQSRLGGDRLPRRLVAPDVAARLFSLDRETLVYDPLPYYRRRAFVTLPRPWEEHPDGRFTMVSNSLGLRMDQEVARLKPDLRLLVVGDSHTDGVCNNAESYTSVAAERLRARWPDKRVEGLNAGTGGHSFYNYLGQIERLLELQPDVVVVGVYGGNDFYEVLVPWHFFRGDELPRMRPEGWKRIHALEGPWRAALPQGHVALCYFQAWPQQLEVALGAALAAMAEIAEVCARAEARLVCLYIPPLADVQPWVQEAERLAAWEVLGLDAESAGAIDRLATRFLAELGASGVEVLDLRPLFRASREPLYWLADHHISVAGQRVAGEALAERLASEGG